MPTKAPPEVALEIGEIRVTPRYIKPEVGREIGREALAWTDLFDDEQDTYVFENSGPGATRVYPDVPTHVADLTFIEKVLQVKEIARHGWRVTGVLAKVNVYREGDVFPLHRDGPDNLTSSLSLLHSASLYYRPRNEVRLGPGDRFAVLNGPEPRQQRMHGIRAPEHGYTSLVVRTFFEMV